MISEDTGWLAEIQQRAATGGLTIYRGLPPTRYVNIRTGAELITRRTDVYGRLAEWRRAPMSRSAP